MDIFSNWMYACYGMLSVLDVCLKKFLLYFFTGYTPPPIFCYISCNNLQLSHMLFLINNLPVIILLFLLIDRIDIVHSHTGSFLYQYTTFKHNSKILSGVF